MDKFWKTIFPGKNCSDENILGWLADGSPDGEQRALDCLYRRLIASVMAWVLKHGGSETDGEDALVDALEGFVKAFRNGKRPDAGKLENYVFGIARFKFFDACRKRKRQGGGGPEISIEDVFPDGIPPEMDWEDPAEKREAEAEDLARSMAVEHCLGQIGERCKERLVRFWHLGQSHEEIARAMGDASADVSKVMKGRCEKRLRDCVAKNLKSGLG